MGTLSFPAHEQSAKSVVPGVRALDDPAARLSEDLSDERLFASSPNVRLNSTQAKCRHNVRVVVALVETKVLRASRTA